MQSSYLCSPVISMSTDILPSKHEQTPKLGYFGLHERFAQQSKIWYSVLTKTAYSIMAQTSSFSATAAFKPVSLTCGLPAVWALPGRSASARSMMLHTSTAVLGEGDATLHPLPGHPNSEELETGLCSILFITPAKKIIGSLENRVRESAPKSPLFHTLIGKEIGSASTSFLSWKKGDAAGWSSCARRANGRASATLIAAIRDSEGDNTLKRWPRMKRLDESGRTLTWTDSPRTPVTARGDSEAERGLVQACRRFVTES